MAGLLGVALGWAGAVTFALGTCHDSGGFCASSFGGTNVVSYAMSFVLLPAGAGLVGAALTRRRGVAAGFGAAAAVVLIALILWVETTG